MAFSFLSDVGSVPSELTFNSVGSCYENTLIGFKSCVDEVKPAISESLDGVKVPTKEELKAFRKAQQKKRKAQKRKRNQKKRNKKNNR